MMAFRLASSRYRIKELLDIMSKDHISTPEKTAQLAEELAAYHQNKAFLKCKSMGELVKMNLKQLLRKNLTQIPKLFKKTD
jgi:aminoglycoside phosphotransferase family enzyme